MTSGPATASPALASGCEWLPTLHKHECSVGRPGGFIERLRRGTYLGHIVEHITLELQMRMGFDVAFGRARGTGEAGVYAEDGRIVAAHGKQTVELVELPRVGFTLDGKAEFQVMNALAATAAAWAAGLNPALR